MLRIIIMQVIEEAKPVWAAYETELQQRVQFIGGDFFRAGKTGLID